MNQELERHLKNAEKHANSAVAWSIVSLAFALLSLILNWPR